MAIAVDATGTLLTSGAASTINYTGITVGSGLTNGVLVVWLVTGANTATATAAWDSAGTNQSMTQLVTGGSRLFIFGLVNPTSGNKNLKITLGTGGTTDIIAQSYTGVNQTGGTTTWPNSNTASGNSNAGSVVITSASGNLPLAITTQGTGLITSVNNTQIFKTAGPPIGAGQTASGSSSVTFSSALASSVSWFYAGVDMVAAGAAGVSGSFNYDPFFDPSRFKKNSADWSFAPYIAPNPPITQNRDPFFDPVKLKRGADWSPLPFISGATNTASPRSFDTFFDPIRLKRGSDFSPIPFVSGVTNTAAPQHDFESFFEPVKLKRGQDWQFQYNAPLQLTAQHFSAFFDPTKLKRGTNWDTYFDGPTVTVFPENLDQFFEPIRLKYGKDWNEPFIAGTTQTVLAMHLAPFFDPVRLKRGDNWILQYHASGTFTAFKMQFDPFFDSVRPNSPAVVLARFTPPSWLQFPFPPVVQHPPIQVIGAYPKWRFLG